jgi:hypothetical protein
MKQKKTYHRVMLLAVFMVFTTVVILSNWVFFDARGRRVSAVSRVNACNGIVISFATFGTRMFRIEPTIRSLLSQSRDVDMIVVHVALVSRTGTVSKNDVFQYLRETFDACVQSSDAHGGIQCSRKLLFLFGPDMGPATKVLGTVRMFPHLHEQACIISVDDDVVYDRNIVSALVENAPSDGGALGFSCEEIPYGLDIVRFFYSRALWWHTISSRDGWRFPFDSVVQCRGWLHGYLGVLYRRGSFGDDVFPMGTTMPDGCYYADDVRLAGYLWTKGIKRYVFPHSVGSGCMNCGHLDKNASDALSMVENTMSLKQWPCVQYFGWD